MQRVPEDIDAMKHLLKYGLLGTDRSVLERIQSDEKLPFVLRKESTDEEVDDDEGSSQNGDEKREKTKLDAIDVKRFIDHRSWFFGFSFCWYFI